ncbi:hypothetical protein BBK82_11400 [Lentzea guizhouensis]|uniref:Uncharacterized protein n=1 Tax=Lentzea guizhouensis TaxID=1586287 RepID=A0A1B2HFU9_9PSEU|nr:hypothetical protein [Lentzea guizhouensis]ANZ36580.1 hypothetical protein BBK82_11400 [Lentzea guizhouensis]
MTLLVRVLTGIVAGVLGTAVTWACHSALHFLGPWMWLLLLQLGIAGTALLYGWLLQLTRQPRPWSVVGPAVLLMVVMVVWGGLVWGYLSFVIPVAGCVLAGVVTPPVPRWRVFRVPTSDYGGMRDGTEHRGQDG